VHTYFVDRSRLGSLEGGRRDRATRAGPRSKNASSSKYRTSTVQSAKKHALNTEKPRITRFDRAAAGAAADRSIDRDD